MGLQEKSGRVSVAVYRRVRWAKGGEERGGGENVARRAASSCSVFYIPARSINAHAGLMMPEKGRSLVLYKVNLPIYGIMSALVPAISPNSKRKKNTHLQRPQATDSIGYPLEYMQR